LYAARPKISTRARLRPSDEALYHPSDAWHQPMRGRMLTPSALRSAASSAAAALLLVVLGACFFPSSGSDDQFSTFWAADALALQGRIVNFAGQAIEQSSTLFFTCAIALVERITRLDAPTLGHLLSLLFGVLAIFEVGALARTMDERLVVPAQLLTAVSAPMMYWSFSGFEATADAWLSLCLCATWVRYLGTGGRVALLRALPALLGFLAVRSEAPFRLLVVLACVAAALASARADRERWQRLGVLAALGALVVAALVVLRLWLFGHAFPLPAYAKAGGPSFDTPLQTTMKGLLYLVGAKHTYFRQRPSEWLPGNLLPFLLVAVLVTAGKIARGARTPIDRSWLTRVLLLGVIAAQVSFIVATGGDWMAGSRFLVPILPPMMLLFVYLGRAWLPKWRLLVASLALYEVLGALALARSASTAVPLWQTVPAAAHAQAFVVRRNRELSETESMVATIEQAISEAERTHARVTFMTAHAGLIPYRLMKRHPELRFIDQFGLSTPEVVTCAALREVPRTPFGILYMGPWYTLSSARAEAECDLRADVQLWVFPPHVIEDTASRLTRAGYDIVSRTDVSEPEYRSGKFGWMVAVRR
jgi:hypothetical protein